MGMFDTVLCKQPLPLPDEVKHLDVDWSVEDFQTKDLDCSMTCYVITETGELLEDVVEREYIPYTEEELEARKKNLKKGSFASLFSHKDVVIKNRYTRPVNYHGKINFYTSVVLSDDEECWLEFEAYFSYGKLDKITLFESRKTVSSKKVNSEWERKRELEEKQLWRKTKNFLGKFGWRRFWLFMASLFSSIAVKSNRLQNAIYRNLL